MNQRLVKEIDEQLKLSTKEHTRIIKELKRLIVEEDKDYQKDLDRLFKQREQVLADIKDLKIRTEQTLNTNYSKVSAEERLAKAKSFLKAWGNSYFCDQQPSNAHRSIKPTKTLSLVQRQILKRLADKVNIRIYDKQWRSYYGDRLKDGRWSVTRYIFYTGK